MPALTCNGKEGKTWIISRVEGVCKEGFGVESVLRLNHIRLWRILAYIKHKHHVVNNGMVNKEIMFKRSLYLVLVLAAEARGRRFQMPSGLLLQMPRQQTLVVVAFRSLQGRRSHVSRFIGSRRSCLLQLQPLVIDTSRHLYSTRLSINRASVNCNTRTWKIWLKTIIKRASVSSKSRGSSACSD